MIEPALNRSHAAVRDTDPHVELLPVVVVMDAAAGILWMLRG
jgi:hypothetical protein